MKIKYSLFVPSYIPYFLESNRVIFVPLDKGTVILVDDKPGFRILNNHEKEMGKEIEKYYNQSSFTDEVGLTINYEVPNNWEFGTFIASIVGIEVVATYIKNKEVDISYVINKCSKYLSLLSISEIFVGPYLFKGSVRVDLKEGFTIIEGLSEDVAIDLTKELKSKLACGGTYKNGNIELQGDHRDAVKQYLLSKGYLEENIIIE